MACFTDLVVVAVVSSVGWTTWPTYICMHMNMMKLGHNIFYHGSDRPMCSSWMWKCWYILFCLDAEMVKLVSKSEIVLCLIKNCRQLIMYAWVEEYRHINNGTIWKCAVSIMFHPLYLLGECRSWNPSVRKTGGPHSQYGHGQGVDLWHLQESYPWLPPYSLITIRTEEQKCEAKIIHDCCLLQFCLF